MELTAAVVAAKIDVMLKEELNYASFKQYFWTDSKVVLNETKRFHTFVASRVQMIRSNTDPKKWRNIDTKNNSDDHALMKSNWFSGPAFLAKMISTKKKSEDWRYRHCAT